MKHINKTLEIPINGRVSELDLQRANDSLYKMAAPSGYILGNTCFSRFTNNGISSRKMPIGDKSSLITIDVDCYYLKQSIVFPYVACVEKSGLDIIDIVMDDLALAKETSALEASVEQPVVAIQFEADITRYSLYYKGKFLSNDTLNLGMSQFSSILKKTLRIPSDVTHRLMYYNLNLKSDNLKEDPLFMWSSKSKNYTISEQQIADLVAEPIVSFLESVVDRISPIYELGKPKIVVIGDVVTIDGFKEVLERIGETEVEKYVSPTIGVRQSRLSSALGAFYFYKDQEVLRTHTLASVDETLFKETVLEVEKHTDEESITQKLKNMFIGR